MCVASNGTLFLSFSISLCPSFGDLCAIVQTSGEKQKKNTIVFFSAPTSFCCSLVGGRILEGRDGLPLDTTKFHLFLELSGIADTREEVRLSTSIAIKGRKPLVPLFFWSFGFLEIANDGIFQRGEESVVDDAIVLPTILRSAHVVGRFGLKPSTLIQIKRRSLDVVKLKGILLKDATDPSRLHPKQGCKQNVKTSPCNTNQRWRTICHVRWVVPHNEWTKKSDCHSEVVIRFNHDISQRLHLDPIGLLGRSFWFGDSNRIVQWLSNPVILWWWKCRCHRDLCFDNTSRSSRRHECHSNTKTRNNRNNNLHASCSQTKRQQLLLFSCFPQKRKM
mmetsp:Transcript_23200/g.53858  ORF Transcript_23200/g.53858 Transcript_23200/m.53858 type:complete len:334 (+) Transcript_23200:195-1196(+)